MRKSFSIVVLFLFIIFGCAPQTRVQMESSFTLRPDRVIAVCVESKNPEYIKEAEKIEIILLEKLKNSNLFSAIRKDRKDADILIRVNITEVVRVRSSDRFLFGAMAGRAKIAGNILIENSRRGETIGRFYVESISSGGTVFAGTTEDVIEQFANQLVDTILSNTVN
ncbi:DUF4410 domain-containing protein [Thermodesulfovibrio hydrogeniphilus]